MNKIFLNSMVFAITFSSIQAATAAPANRNGNSSTKAQMCGFPVDDLKQDSVFMTNVLPESVRLVARCQKRGQPQVRGCVVTATPKDSQLNENGPYLIFETSPYDADKDYSSGYTFFTDHATVDVSDSEIIAKDNTAKGLFGRPGRFGGEGAEKVQLSLDLETGDLRYKLYETDESIKLPIFINWQLKDDWQFQCEIVK